jgi:methyl-accepting chemotaxis protein
MFDHFRLSTRIALIAKALTQMEQLTQRAAAGAEESAAASEELNAQSVAMKDSVRRLRTLISGSSRFARP